jgi:hypothetical protein
MHRQVFPACATALEIMLKICPATGIDVGVLLGRMASVPRAARLQALGPGESSASLLEALSEHLLCGGGGGQGRFGSGGDGGVSGASGGGLGRPQEALSRLAALCDRAGHTPPAVLRMLGGFAQGLAPEPHNRLSSDEAMPLALLLMKWVGP